LDGQGLYIPEAGEIGFASGVIEECDRIVRAEATNPLYNLQETLLESLFRLLQIKRNHRLVPLFFDPSTLNIMPDLNLVSRVEEGELPGGDVESPNFWKSILSVSDISARGGRRLESEQACPGYSGT
jgi:hypothetical protein